MTPELLKGDFLVWEPVGKLLYEDPLCTEYVVVHQAWGMRVRGGSAYMVHAEFVSDGGSLPSLFWLPLGNPFSRARAGYILHDAAYHRRLLCFQPDGTVRLISKREADELMYQVALWNGMTRKRMRAVFAGVHLFGGSSWEKYEEDQTDPMVLLSQHRYAVPT